ncbi:MAG: FkbM family methyltransferase [Candidatus Acidiferrales bacterium]
MLLFDVGASFGIFSMAAAHVGGKAVAVDPSPIATHFIKIESQLNKYSENIEIVQACVSDSSGLIEMLDAGVFSDGYFKVARGRPSNDLRQTQAITIDQMAAKFGTPTHIKIDVEGHEAAVVRGAKNTLSNFSPLLFIELHNDMVRKDGGDPNRILNELLYLGYGVFDVAGLPIERDAALQKPIIRVMASRSRP